MGSPPSANCTQGNQPKPSQPSCPTAARATSASIGLGFRIAAVSGLRVRHLGVPRLTRVLARVTGLASLTGLAGLAGLTGLAGLAGLLGLTVLVHFPVAVLVSATALVQGHIGVDRRIGVYTVRAAPGINGKAVAVLVVVIAT